MKYTLTIQDLFIYPIKSLGGIRLNEAQAEERGFRYDRRWMLVDHQGAFVSQRTFPQLALLGVELFAKHLLVFHKYNPSQKLEISLDLAEGPEIPVVIWDDEVLGKLVSKEVDRWFSDFLGFGVHLVVMPETTHRKVDPRYAVKGENVSFADGMPYLLISQESLDELNSRLEIPVPMNRFRPNIVISGGEPFIEDQLKAVQIGGLDFRIVKPCARCVLTTVDQETGEKGKEPLRTLSLYRTQNNKVMFGQNVIALQSGVIRVGDEVNY
ncbi:MOSC domain-containing protein [Algoriphagus mannitolivorans]|uniref:MOSC domain-containing protein n=1 Tax=Algoriphagus mannitolivorans TaxID=226504 RepID=UPI001FE0D09D|nr:MOSC N-terminal beta barrel domain-containing protein [Algoriphagus mannitolivorans]